MNEYIRSGFKILTFKGLIQDYRTTILLTFYTNQEPRDGSALRRHCETIKMSVEQNLVVGALSISPLFLSTITTNHLHLCARYKSGSTKLVSEM